ncbi:glycosyltransferase [Cupriavidus plantarum]|uniref:glycosyltransferase n=1 Tax=Cupriavidus plantarum TaxID=942865 RepID=UPI000EB3A60C|nr:glycosyltransferase [Cupriavidus plantarum]NYH98078.1 glycosyltransferase involved in cell wall biosynthesis [Cupriavidus plantarum]RLK35491.1 glycosyltransferase involved in cell wall biosynthesis [Cupriavidus plantarum]
MRILLIATGLKVGGAEHQVAALAGAFHALGHAVAIVSLSPGREIEVPGGVEVIELAMRKTPAGFVRALWRARAFVRAWRPGVIHAHMVHANLFARALTRIVCCPPVVCTAHSYHEGGRARMLAYRLTDPWCALTTHVSEAGRAAMIATGAAPATRIAVMPNGIDIGRFRFDASRRTATRERLGIQAGTPLLLHVGRLVPAKAQRLLVDALPDVFARLDGDGDRSLRHSQPARLLIAGGGPLHDALAAQIRAHGLDDRVTLLGPRHDVPALLDAADAFVLSSDIEGSPLVLAEALASGCPVVSTDAPGVREIVGGLGLIVPRGDTEALANAIATTLTEGRGDATAQAARRDHIRNTCALDTVAQHWLACYVTLGATAGDARLETT